MSLGVRSRLFLAATLLIAITVAIALAYLTPALDRMLIERIRADLQIRTGLVAREVGSAHLPADDIPRWDALADELAGEAQARVTLIRSDGKVLGDSDLRPEEVDRLENHASRVEVSQALRQGRAWSTRFSSTLQQRMIYTAATFGAGGKIEGVARLAMPLTQVDAATRTLSRILLAGSVLAMVVVLVLSGLVAQIYSRPLRAVTQAAQEMARGDLSVRTGLRGRDEVAMLGQVLDQFAAGFSQTVDDLRSERDLLEGILSGMGEGILVLDPSRRILLINPALREMLLLPADVVGKTLLEAIRHAELKETLDRSLDGAAGAGRASEIEIAGLKPRRLLVHATPLPGLQHGLLAVFVDVTDLRRLESLRRDFVANVSHELRTPVTAIRSGIETLHSAVDDKGAREKFMAIVDRNADRLQRLVEDLLDLSRIESREYHFHLESLDLRPVIQDALQFHRDRAEAKGIDLQAEIPGGIGAVLADRRALDQILGNLIDNAIKYCPERAVVNVQAAAEEGRVKVSVIDNGPGIEPHHLDRLFERFYRVDAGRSRELGGTGLGLAIVKHLVEAMAGTVMARSTLGEGATFSFTLPRG